MTATEMDNVFVSRTSLARRVNSVPLGTIITLCVNRVTAIHMVRTTCRVTSKLGSVIVNPLLRE